MQDRHAVPDAGRARKTGSTLRAVAGREERHFTDAQGTAWRVFEHRYDDEPAFTLIFESDHAFRRVRSYPANWRSLPAPELEALSWKP